MAEKAVKVAEEIVTKPRFSFDGWNIKDWLKGNWNTILEISKVAGPYILSLQIFREDPALQALVVLAGKLVLDTLHYWLNKHTE